MIDYYDVFRRSVWGDVTAEEIARVAAELDRPDSEADSTILLAILGEAGAVQHRLLVERYLQPGTDPWVARKALQVLSVDWSLTDKYLDKILEFVKGVAWDDEDGELRGIAMWEAGRYLSRHREPRLLRELIGIAEDPDEDPGDRVAAYGHLVDALGKPLTALDVPAEAYPTALEEAKRRLAQQGG